MGSRARNRGIALHLRTLQARCATGLCGVLFALLTACTGGPKEARSYAQEEFTVALPALESAAIAAELLAEEFVPRDLPQGAWIERRSRGRFRVYYQSPNGSRFQPQANSRISRVHYLTQSSPSFLSNLPRSAIGEVRIRPVRPVGPVNSAGHWVWIEVEAAGATSRVWIECEGGAFGTAELRIAALRNALALVEGLNRALAEFRKGRRQRARLTLEDCLRKHSQDLGAHNDALLAQASALLALMHEERGEWELALRYCNHALLLAPRAAELYRFRSKLASKVADPIAMRKAAETARFYDLNSTPQQSQDQSTASSRTSYADALESAERQLAARDYTSAIAWANRAIDLEGPTEEALLLLARAHSGKRDWRSARSVALRSIQRHGVSQGSATILIQAERALGNDQMALRILVRHARNLPSLVSESGLESLIQRLGPLTAARVLRDEGERSMALMMLAKWAGSKPSRQARILGIWYQTPDIFAPVPLPRSVLAPPFTGASGVSERAAPATPGR